LARPAKPLEQEKNNKFMKYSNLNFYKIAYLLLTAIFAVTLTTCGPPPENPDDGYKGGVDVKDRVTVVKTEQEIQSGTVVLDGVATVEIPNGAFLTQQKVVLEKMTSASTTMVFNEFSDFFDVSVNLPYFVRFASKACPETDEVLITFTVPDNFASTISAEQYISVFAQIYADGGEETLDLFEHLTGVEYNNVSKTVSVKLPQYAFSKERKKDEYEVVLTLAATPWKNNDIGTAKTPSKERGLAKYILCPVEDLYGPYRISSRFGLRTDPVTQKPKSMHNGMDFAAATGHPVYAAEDGVVETARAQRDKDGNIVGAGLYIAIKHKDGNKTRYMHLSQLNVASGDRVCCGQIIGKVGSTGKSTGPHLHFEYFVNEVPIDPEPYLTPDLKSATIHGFERYNYNGNYEEVFFCFDDYGRNQRIESYHYNDRNELEGWGIVIYNSFRYTPESEFSTVMYGWGSDSQTWTTQVYDGVTFEHTGLLVHPQIMTTFDMYISMGYMTKTNVDVAGNCCVEYKGADVNLAIWRKRVMLRGSNDGDSNFEAISATIGCPNEAFAPGFISW